jgi:hypothetical protein
MVTLCAVREVRGKALLRQNVQPGEQSQGLLEIEIINVAASLLVQQFQCQQAQQRGIGRHHLRSRIASLVHQFVEPQPRQERQEQEQPRHARSQSQGFGCRKNQFLAVGNVRNLILGVPFLTWRRLYGRSSDREFPKKGDTSVGSRHCSRNSYTNCRRELCSNPNCSATSFCDRPSTNTARSAS